jgi:hypothetical protein
LKMESVFKINSEILFAFVGEALHLQEVYLTFDARKQQSAFTINFLRQSLRPSKTEFYNTLHISDLMFG